MKVLLLLTLCLYSCAAPAIEYYPLEGEFGPFTQHELFDEFKKARESRNLQEAVTNWEAFVDRLNVDEAQIEDMTQYQLIKAGLSELMRVYYLIGDSRKGDTLLRKFETFQPIDPEIEKKWKYLCGGNVELMPGEKI